MDACPTGFGALLVSGKRGYALPLPEWFRKFTFHINCLEALNLLVALRTWIDRLRHHDVIIRTDNTTACWAVKTGRSRDTLIIDIAKEVTMLMCTSDVFLTVEHMPGVTLA